MAAEMALSVLANNLTRVMNIVGTKPLMDAIAAGRLRPPPAILSRNGRDERVRIDIIPKKHSGDVLNAGELLGQSMRRSQRSTPLVKEGNRLARDPAQ